MTIKLNIKIYLLLYLKLRDLFTIVCLNAIRAYLNIKLIYHLDVYA